MAESKEQKKVADLDEKEVSQSEAAGVKGGAAPKPKESGPVPIPYPNLRSP
jgi:hypothetical protein